MTWLAILGYGVIQGLDWLLRILFDGNVRDLRDAYVLLVIVAFGVFRVVGFHPIFRPKYRKWLMLTPWDYRQPLPLGPLYLLPQDLLVIAVATLGAYDSQSPVVAIPTVFLLTNSLVLIASLWFSKPGISAYLLLFAPGFVVRLWNWNPVASFVAAAVSCVWAQLDVQRSLAEFPWDDQLKKFGWLQRQLKNPRGRSNPDQPHELQPMELSWQFRLLHPKYDAPSIPSWLVPACIALAVWYYYVLLSGVEESEVFKLGLLLYGYICFSAITIRLFLYCWHYWSPISPWGRLWTLRWIIPNYDQVFIAPLMGFLGTIGLPWLMAKTEVNPLIGLPICLSLVLLIIGCTGPSLRRWRLTGNYRLWPGFVQPASVEQI
jgi:hypothetical protein